ncbi:YybH family protein [Candidatus Nitrospira bockiana]
MNAVQPQDLHRLFADAFSAGNVDAVLALYEPGAVLVPEPGRPPVTGEAIRQVLETFLALKPRVTCATEQAIESGGVALLRSRWTLTGTAPDGTPVEMSQRGIEIARRQPDGSWRFLIDDPFGGA